MAMMRRITEINGELVRYEILSVRQLWEGR